MIEYRGLLPGMSVFLKKAITKEGLSSSCLHPVENFCPGSSWLQYNTGAMARGLISTVARAVWVGHVSYPVLSIRTCNMGVAKWQRHNRSNVPPRETDPPGWTLEISPLSQCLHRVFFRLYLQSSNGVLDHRGHEPVRYDDIPDRWLIPSRTPGLAVSVPAADESATNHCHRRT